jgi:hypothetical protein
VVLKSATRKSFRVDDHRGHWKKPMTEALLLQVWALDSLP